MGIEDRDWPSNAYSTGELPAHPLSLCNPMKPLQMQWEKELWSCRNRRESTARTTFSISFELLNRKVFAVAISEDMEWKKKDKILYQYI